MAYNEISDDELMMMISEENADAKDMMYNKYRYIVSLYVKKYKNIASVLGIDLKDLNQEALVGFSDALVSYKSNKDASLKTFISMCVERRLKNIVLKASRKKNQVLNESLSLEYDYQNFDTTLADIISDNNENNPLTKLTRDERYKYIVKTILNSLSNNEKDVLYLMIDGLNYQEISDILNIPLKSVDNTIQRIKNKVKDIMLVSSSL